MGWASGSSLMNEVIDALKKNVPNDKQRQLVYATLIDAFENEDCDTLDECQERDPAWDAAYRKLHPDYFDDSDE